MKIYGVYGKNAAGIYTKWSAVLKGQKFVSGHKVKSFKSVIEAAEFIIDGLENNYCVVGAGEVTLQSFEKYDWLYYLNELRFSHKKI